MNPNINTQFTSLFVYHVLIKNLGALLAASAGISLVARNPAMVQEKDTSGYFRLVASPLLCLAGTLHCLQFDEPITDRASFDLVIEALREQFDVAEDFPAVEAEAMELMEHALAYARQAGLDALEEALSGFAVSGGDLEVWETHRLMRDHRLKRFPGN